MATYGPQPDGSVIVDDRPIISETCFMCKHVDVTTKTCTAFPEGIPDALWMGDHDHKTSFPGDNGIQFEEIENA